MGEQRERQHLAFNSVTWGLCGLLNWAYRSLSAKGIRVFIREGCSTNQITKSLQRDGIKSVNSPARPLQNHWGLLFLWVKEWRGASRLLAGILSRLGESYLYLDRALWLGRQALWPALEEHMRILSKTFTDVNVLILTATPGSRV